MVLARILVLFEYTDFQDGGVDCSTRLRYNHCYCGKRAFCALQHYYVDTRGRRIFKRVRTAV